MRVLLIDDKADKKDNHRKRLLEICSQERGIEFDMVLPKEKDLKPLLDQIDCYSLILVDYRFDTSGSPMFKSGASLYSILRDYSKDIPIYLISVIEFDTDLIGEFDLFVRDRLLSDRELFEKEINDHESLKQITSIEDFKNLLKVPDEENEEIDLILAPIFPDNKEISNSFAESLNIRAFRWFIESFINKEGPTVSEEGAALTLGISPQYFRKISKDFEAAEYKGIFHLSKNKRWWPCLLEDIVLDKPDEDNLFSKFPFKKASSIILGAEKEEDFSSCVKCDERYPESLGKLPSDNAIYHVHIACSAFKSSTKDEPFFRSYREISGD